MLTLYTVLLDLKLMLACTVPVCKITHIECAQPDLHANENPSCVTHERHGRASLVTRYMLASTNNTLVKEFTLVRRVTHKFVNLSVL